MIKDIQTIFEAITPDNIQDLPLIKAGMKIFIETLEELSKESIDIKNVYENETIRKELIKIYLDDMYNVFQSVKFNQKIIERINKSNKFYGSNYYNVEEIFNLETLITDEHFLTFKAFKEHKGTTASINYIYDLLNVFITSNNESLPFELIPEEPFKFQIQGGEPEEFYQHIIRPLAHPLGFVYQYQQYITQSMTDYFPEEGFEYTVNALEVRSLFSDGSTTVINFHPYIDPNTSLEIDFTVTDYKNETDVTSGTRTKIIVFDDGSYLKQETTAAGQTSVFYMSSADSIITEFAGQSSIYFAYDFTFNTKVKDDSSMTHQTNISDFGARTYVNKEDEILPWDKGINTRRDRDGQLLKIADQGEANGRKEHYFSPSEEADLKLLEGKYSKNVQVKDGETVLGIDPIHFEENINPENQVVSRVISKEGFISQNIGNEDYFAKEHEIIDMDISPESNTYVENKADESTDIFYEVNQENLNIGDHDYYIRYKSVSITDNIESYGENNEFHLLSDEDNFDFGVYRGNELITDNNVSNI